MKIFYSQDYVLSEYSFDTTRKSGWLVDTLDERPIAGVEIIPPISVTEEELCLVHEPAYVQAVRTGIPRNLAMSQGFKWDKKLWTMTTASTGGVVAAVDIALKDGVSGSLSSGLHHARYDHGSGFCTFNGLALAAVKALDAGVKSVLILDLDAHCGGGTHSLIGDNPAIRHLDVSVSSFDIYDPTGRNTLDMVTEADLYLPTISKRLDELEESDPPFGLCLYNAGMDTYELPGISATVLKERENLVFEWCRRCNIPIAFVLAGGYVGPNITQEKLVNLHRLTLESASHVFTETFE